MPPQVTEERGETYPNPNLYPDPNPDPNPNPNPNPTFSYGPQVTEERSGNVTRIARLAYV